MTTTTTPQTEDAMTALLSLHEDIDPERVLWGLAYLARSIEDGPMLRFLVQMAMYAEAENERYAENAQSLDDDILNDEYNIPEQCRALSIYWQMAANPKLPPDLVDWLIERDCFHLIHGNPDSHEPSLDEAMNSDYNIDVGDLKRPELLPRHIDTLLDRHVGDETLIRFVGFSHQQMSDEQFERFFRDWIEYKKKKGRTNGDFSIYEGSNESKIIRIAAKGFRKVSEELVMEVFHRCRPARWMVAECGYLSEESFEKIDEYIHELDDDESEWHKAVEAFLGNKAIPEYYLHKYFNEVKTWPFMAANPNLDASMLRMLIETGNHLVRINLLKSPNVDALNWNKTLHALMGEATRDNTARSAIISYNSYGILNDDRITTETLTAYFEWLIANGLWRDNRAEYITGICQSHAATPELMDRIIHGAATGNCSNLVAIFYVVANAFKRINPTTIQFILGVMRESMRHGQTQEGALSALLTQETIDISQVESIVENEFNPVVREKALKIIERHREKDRVIGYARVE